MKPKQKKHVKEDATESHFIVNKEDVKHATEKLVKESFNEKYLSKKVTEKPIKENIQNTFSVEKNIQNQ